MIKRILKEPLLHFLLIGAGLFLLFYEVVDPALGRSNSIVVTAADVERLQTQWQRQWRRPPTQLELKAMIDGHIREMILYREALALGLDQDDVIVRRRLGQKLEFLFKDLAEQIEPGDAELEQFLTEHRDRYIEPERYTFTHIYLNYDERGDAIRTDAENILLKLRDQPGTIDPTRFSDRFLYQYQFDQQTPGQISRIFGNVFADGLAGLKVGEWQGPVESGYGLHLVLIEERTEPRQPPLVEVKNKVRWDVIAQRRKEVDTAFYNELRQRYDVTIQLEDGVESIQ